jgi:N-acetylglucosaminyldiphosphoundecaprenol N-acetyl-beta-D-mannosaminyltransferase
MFGIPIADLTMAETLDLIRRFVDDGRSNRGTHQISTVNVDFIVNALGDPDVAGILRTADVCLADGMPIVWGSRLLGMPIRERVAGSDLLPMLIDASQSTGQHVHIFGSAPDVADAARRLLRERYPNARFSIDPGPLISVVEAVADSVLESIRSVDPDVLCVALGNPKQERFIRAHRARLGTPVLIGVGGSLDMLVGRRKRAPNWVQRIGMEWVVRAAQEPRRLGRRYAHDIWVFGPAFARLWYTAKRRRGTTSLALSDAGETVRVDLRGAAAMTPERWSEAAGAVGSGSPLQIDAAHARSIDDVAAAQLIGLVQLARWREAPVTWTGADEPLIADFVDRGITPAMLGLPVEWP